MLNIRTILQLTRFDKPVGIFLLLWPSWQTILLSSQHFPVKIFCLITLGTILMRATGCVINDICDANFDAKVSRTKNRPLAAKLINTNQAICIAIIGLLLSFTIAIQLPITCWLLAVIGAGLAIIYPTSKRWCLCPQLILGIAFAWPVVMTTAALEIPLTQTNWLLFVASILQPIAYDSWYALTDKADDLKLPIHSSAKWWQEKTWQIIAIIYACWGSCWLLIAYKQQSNSIFFATIICISIISYHLKETQLLDPIRCLQAFKVNQHLGWILCIAIYLAMH